MIFGLKKFTTIDIGSHAIKVVRMKNKNSGLEILNAVSKKVPPDIIEKGKIIDHSIIVSKLENIFEEMNYRPGKVITTISNQNLIIRNLELPVMPEEELQEAIRWEADDHLPYPAEQASLDYIILNRKEENINVLIVAVKEEILDNFLTTFDQFGIKPSVVNVQPMAVLSLLEQQGELTEPVAVIDIGCSGFRVTIGSRKKIFLFRTLETGGKEFTETLMEEMDLDFHEAEKYKINNGINETEEEIESEEYDLASLQVAAGGMGTGNFMQMMAKNLAEEISRSLDFYSMKNRGKPVNKVFVTGGGSRLKGLKKIIKQEIDQDLIPVTPFAEFNYVAQSSNDNLDDFCMAVGLGVSEVLNYES